MIISINLSYKDRILLIFLNLNYKNENDTKYHFSIGFIRI